MVTTNKSWFSGKLVVVFRGLGVRGVPCLVALEVTEEDLVLIVIRAKK